jgi:hypothetical protein
LQDQNDCMAMFDMDNNFDDQPFPDEDIPHQENIEDEDSAWEDDSDDDNDDKSGDKIFHHCFESDNPSLKPTRRRHLNPQTYRARIQAERAHWKEQEQALVMAYMEWKVHGAAMENEGEGLGYFDCQIFSLTGT